MILRNDEPFNSEDALQPAQPETHSFSALLPNANDSRDVSRVCGRLRKRQFPKYGTNIIGDIEQYVHSYHAGKTCLRRCNKLFPVLQILRKLISVSLRKAMVLWTA